jgi:hypothetical protein
MSTVTFNVNFFNVNSGWQYLKKQFKINSILLLEKKKRKKLTDDEKLYSFLKHSLLPSTISKKSDKFFVLRNDKKDYINFGFSENISDHNWMVIEVIMNGFIILYFALYYLFNFLDDYQLIEERETLCDKLFNISIFFKFQNMFFNEYYESNDNIQDLSKSYIFDIYYYDTYLDLFNFYLFNDLKMTIFLYNFEKYRYEEALILNNFDVKLAEKFKLTVDYFFFEFLELHNDLYFALCIYEFFVSFSYEDFRYHDINYEFFSKIKVYDDNKLLDVAKYDQSLFRYKTFLNIKNKYWSKKELASYFLTSTYFSFSLKFLRKKKNNIVIKDKKDIGITQKLLHIKYKDLEFNENDKILDLKNFILDYKYYSIKMPIIIFLLYSWYAIYYKRLRYNAYIGGAISYFNEKFSRLHYFIYLNNTRSSNLWKFAPLKYQKLNTVYHFKSYIELKIFNDQFLFYFALKSDLIKYINNDLLKFQNNFRMLLSNEHLKQFLKMKNYIYNNIISLFFNENLTLNAFNYEMLESYTLFMQTPVIKFNKLFSLGRLGFLEYDTLLETVFAFPGEIKALQFFIEEFMIYEYYFSIFKDNINKYFINDFFNYKTILDLKKYNKILTFFNKLIYIVFFLLDPFFFKYFWKRSFPTKWNQMWKIYNYVWTYLFMVKFFYGVENYGVLEFNTKIYSFFMFYLNWRIDTSTSVGINYWSSDMIGFNFIIINMLYKNRFIEIIKQIHLLMNYNNIKNKNKYLYYYYLLNLKNFYFDLLYCNIEYCIIFFFNNKQKFFNLACYYNNITIKDFIFYNFIYRYYVSVVLFQNHYYDDWFYDWNKRILMTYVDNFHKHEGKFFYSKKADII